MMDSPKKQLGPTEMRSLLQTLTKNEVEYLKLICQDKSTEEIKDIVHSSVPALDRFRGEIFTKLMVDLIEDTEYKQPIKKFQKHYCPILRELIIDGYVWHHKPIQKEAIAENLQPPENPQPIENPQPAETPEPIPSEQTEVTATQPVTPPPPDSPTRVRLGWIIASVVIILACCVIVGGGALVARIVPQAAAFIQSLPPIPILNAQEETPVPTVAPSATVQINQEATAFRQTQTALAPIQAATSTAYMATQEVIRATPPTPVPTPAFYGENEWVRIDTDKYFYLDDEFPGMGWGGCTHDRSNFSLKFVLVNRSDGDFVVTFDPADILIFDNLGNKYELLAAGIYECSRDLLPQREVLSRLTDQALLPIKADGTFPADATYLEITFGAISQKGPIVFRKSLY